MKPLTNQNVESYYRQVNDMLGKACISNMKEEDIDSLCVALKMKIDTLNQLKRNLPPSVTIFDKFALDLISDLAPIESSKYLENRTEEQCNLTYDQDHNEYRIWIIALMTMSWIITNWKRKTEDGHCQNRKHWRDPQDSFCPMGSKFHKGLYNECIRTFKNILNITADAGCNSH